MRLSWILEKLSAKPEKRAHFGHRSLSTMSEAFENLAFGTESSLDSNLVLIPCSHTYITRQSLEPGFLWLPGFRPISDAQPQV